MNLPLILLIGLLAALTMFTGDMLLYYDKEDFKSDGTFNPIIKIMKNVSQKRLYVGGFIGPIAAFLYCIGYYHVILVTDQRHQTLATVGFFIYCLGIILGGTYHSHCAYLGLIGKLENEEAMDVVTKFFYKINLLSMPFFAVGMFIQFLLILLGWTDFPRIFAIFAPIILYAFLPLTRKLPKGLHIIINGGWGNLIFIIYYFITLIYTLNNY